VFNDAAIAARAMQAEGAEIWGGFPLESRVESILTEP
jgi:hypothetical protein